MRIVHQVEGQMQVGAGCRPYAKTCGADKSSGMHVELTICGPDDEVIEIEGDGAWILRMLKDAMAALKGAEEVMVDKGQVVPDWYEREAGGERKP